MLAVPLYEHGPAEVLQAGEFTTPVIDSPTQVMIRLHAAGINPVDTKLRAGAYPIKQLPLILGCDGAGEIIEVGGEVKRVKAGDAVYFFHGGISDIHGNYAEYAVIDERFLTKKPDSLDYVEAAAAPLVLLTAWESLFDRARLQAGQTVFINAGAGGVGHVAIQLARNAGARVCTTISSDEKARFVEALGAECIINYKEQDIPSFVNDWTNGQGVDIAIDNVGGKETQNLFPLVKHYGDIVSLLLPPKETDLLVARQKNLRLSLEVMLSPQAFGLVDAQKHQTQILEQCAQQFDTGKLKVHVSDVFPLKDVARAHHLIESGHTTGKIVLNTLL